MIMNLINFLTTIETVIIGIKNVTEKGEEV